MPAPSHKPLHSRNSVSVGNRQPKLQAKGHPVDLALVEAGALLHDLGRSKTHGVDHGCSRRTNRPNNRDCRSLLLILLSGMSAQASLTKKRTWLEWPAGNYVPTTLEEKIVCYADKRIDHDSR